jgi:hypothetical protein
MKTCNLLTLKNDQPRLVSAEDQTESEFIDTGMQSQCIVAIRIQQSDPLFPVYGHLWERENG